METTNKLGSLLAILTFLTVALLLTATLAYAQGVAGTGGVYAVPVSGVPAGRLPLGDNASAQPEPSCHDSFKNQNEYGTDCGGVCVTGDAEVCDGIDNDKDCLVDDGNVCGEQKATVIDEEATSKLRAQPIPVPERMPDGPIPDYIVYNGPDEAMDNAVTAYSSDVVAAVPAIPVPEPVEVANVEGVQSKGEAAAPVIADKSPQPSKPINDESKVENLPKSVVKPQAPSFFSKVKVFLKRFFG
ncbi:hypothetical protein HYV85_00645 [Candidatus Woesearchaeota archaeon]|nr:hypothetical protein [Candidatus Woesearchaeota archaeon]